MNRIDNVADVDMLARLDPAELGTLEWGEGLAPYVDKVFLDGAEVRASAWNVADGWVDCGARADAVALAPGQSRTPKGYIWDRTLGDGGDFVMERVTGTVSFTWVDRARRLRVHAAKAVIQARGAA